MLASTGSHSTESITNAQSPVHYCGPTGRENQGSCKSDFFFHPKLLESEFWTINSLKCHRQSLKSHIRGKNCLLAKSKNMMTRRTKGKERKWWSTSEDWQWRLRGSNKQGCTLSFWLLCRNLCDSVSHLVSFCLLDPPTSLPFGLFGPAWC